MFGKMTTTAGFGGLAKVWCHPLLSATPHEKRTIVAAKN